MSEKPDIIKAVVVKVIPNGRHGPYAVAKPTLVQHQQDLGISVTFSIVSGEAWKEAEPPSVGLHVNLIDLRKCNAGWRADNVSPVQP